MRTFFSTLSLLGVLFVGLKLGHVIAWSWWWVLVPFWGVPAIITGGVLSILALIVFGSALAARQDVKALQRPQ